MMPSLAIQHESRRRFLELVGDLRPQLHRYCARMTGSIADGEDMVQETLASAYYMLCEMDPPPELRPWLFRIAHNRAVDHLRRYEVRMSEPLESVQEQAIDPAPEPDDTLAHEQAVRAAVSRFIELAPAQRSCVILKDVLGHSLEEIAVLLQLSMPAVKAALHRGRKRLRDLGPGPPALRAVSPIVLRYADLFNARDWDGVRSLLAEDVRLSLVSRLQRVGRRNVGNYFSNYDRIHDWHLVPAWLDGREVIAVFRQPQDAQCSYFIELSIAQGLITTIHDFRYVAYIAVDADVQRA